MVLKIRLICAAPEALLLSVVVPPRVTAASSSNLAPETDAVVQFGLRNVSVHCEDSAGESSAEHPRRSIRVGMHA